MRDMSMASGHLLASDHGNAVDKTSFKPSEDREYENGTHVANYFRPPSILTIASLYMYG